jgi:hypothetical protein
LIAAPPFVDTVLGEELPLEPEAVLVALPEALVTVDVAVEREPLLRVALL